MDIETDTTPANPESNRVLLIDLENCPSQINQLMKNLEQFSQVVICYAQSGAKVPIDWILPLTSTVNSNKLKIFKTPGAGKNAADFGITFWAGVLMQQLPQNTHFTVVSEDTDLDHVINLLKSQGRSAERINTKNEANPKTPALAIALTPLQEYCIHLVKHSKTRPAKKDTLLNSIKIKYKDNPHMPEAVFDELLKHEAIIVKDNRIQYNDAILNRLVTA
ncbi:MAG: PIN domain-containing protein [Proteobacteria bacterium]|nr:PIN domain-containing protein [Pseudomonadota bacterium]